jgi:carbon storage regulator CsrA
MLVLSRRLQEQIRIGDQVTITILRVKGNTVRIGIEAPRNTRIVRAELPSLESDGPTTLEANLEIDDASSRPPSGSTGSVSSGSMGKVGEAGKIGKQEESYQESHADPVAPLAARDSYSRELRLNRIKNRLRGHWPTPAPN